MCCIFEHSHTSMHAVLRKVLILPSMRVELPAAAAPTLMLRQCCIHAACCRVYPFCENGHIAGCSMRTVSTWAGRTSAVTFLGAHYGRSLFLQLTLFLLLLASESPRFETSRSFMQVSAVRVNLNCFCASLRGLREVACLIALLWRLSLPKRAGFTK